MSTADTSSQRPSDEQIASDISNELTKESHMLKLGKSLSNLGPADTNSLILAATAILHRASNTTETSPAISSSLSSSDSSDALNKRLQVPRACSNCRKQHAGCDLQRPCKRCVQNGLEELCSDVPRKKRLSKKRSRTEEPLIVKEEVQNQPTQYQQPFTQNVPAPKLSPSTIPTPQNYHQPQQNYTMHTNPIGQFFPHNHYIHSHLHHHISNQTPNFTSSNWTPQNECQTDGISHIYNGGYDQNVLNDMSTMQNLLPPGSRDLSREISPGNSRDPSPPPPLSQTNTVLNNTQLSFLLTLISELKESNKLLESKLLNVTEELQDFKRQKLAQQSSTSSILPGSTSLSGLNWHSFATNTDLAISVWRSDRGTSTLIECNQKFVDTVGYPLSTLRSGFTCSKLIPLNSREAKEAWAEQMTQANLTNGSRGDAPRRTQIVTSQGVRDIYLSISTIVDNEVGCQYWIVHTLVLK